jgi:hypothetical protein
MGEGGLDHSFRPIFITVSWTERRRRILDSLDGLDSIIGMFSSYRLIVERFL